VAKKPFLHPWNGMIWLIDNDCAFSVPLCEVEKEEKKIEKKAEVKLSE
jgi:hypothetical protein